MATNGGPPSANSLSAVKTFETMEVVNRLITIGVDIFPHLSQIVTIGETSIGKTSIIDAISSFDLSTRDASSTRFATEVIYRPAKVDRLVVSVNFANQSLSSRAFVSPSLGKDDVENTIREAKKLITFPEGGSISRDVLRIEHERTIPYYKKFVDLPGLSRINETVTDLVERYVRQPTSLILVITSSSVQLEENHALSMARKHDPLGERTFTIFNKIQLADEVAKHTRLGRIANNEEFSGEPESAWHALPYVAQIASGAASLLETEDKALKLPLWRKIPPQNAGISRLRPKLNSALSSLTRNNLSRIIGTTASHLQKRELELSNLGEPKTRLEDLRVFLLEVASIFQRLVCNGVQGQYGDPFFGNPLDEECKLRAQLLNFSDALNYIMDINDHSYGLTKINQSAQKHRHLSDFLERYSYQYQAPEEISDEQLTVYLEEVTRIDRGEDLHGYASQELVCQLLRKLAAPWKSIAEFHMSRVCLVVKAFVDQVIVHAVGQNGGGTAQVIMREFVDPFFENKERVLRCKLEELLHPYSSGYAFAQSMSKVHHQTSSEKSIARLADRLAKTFLEEHPDLFQESTSQKPLTRDLIFDVVEKAESQNESEMGSDVVLDAIFANFEVCRRTFTYSICNLAIEGCLIRELPHILTPSKVLSISEELLLETGKEPEELLHKREVTRKEIEELRQILQKLQILKPRGITALTKKRRCSSPQLDSVKRVTLSAASQNSTPASRAARRPSTPAPEATLGPRNTPGSGNSGERNNELAGSTSNVIKVEPNESPFASAQGQRLSSSQKKRAKRRRPRKRYKRRSNKRKQTISVSVAETLRLIRQQRAAAEKMAAEQSPDRM
ncbi:hypothetical protein HIM_06079 [Hirsutella minnesotensis 3608]|uniref:GED domain-containing protein n=1 Tax=Hirsutella minnesotensis 3608 TaxID=1043627 RepID=A0A0F7ZU97_9HYPO|nr:hypothetical protein HIM_06079 [Hirsutella minnesotensis 3608]